MLWLFFFCLKHTGTCCAVDTSSGYTDGPGGDNGSFSNFATKDHASRAVDDPGGDIDDPGGGTTNDGGSFSNLTTSASTSSKASASYVSSSSSLTTRVSLLSLSDKSTADMVKCANVVRYWILFVLHVPSYRI